MSNRSRFNAQFGGGGGGGGGLKQLEVGVTPIIGGTVGRLLFEGTGNVLGESNGLVWDITNSRLGIRTTSPDCTLDVHSSGTSNARGVQVAHVDNTNAFSQAKFIGRRSRGTEASPTAILANDSIVSFNGRGRKANSWSDTVGGFYIYANENWTDSATGTFISFRGVNNGGTTVNEWMRISEGNLGINQTTPSALLNIKGKDDLAGSVSFFVENNSGNIILRGRNNGAVDFSFWGDSTFNSAKLIGLTNQPGTHLDVVSYGTNTNTTLGSTNVRVVSSFAPTSGNASYTNLLFNSTINQTGGANGTVRAIYIDNTLTSAPNYRAIETTNDVGYSFYGSGTAPIYSGGRLGIRRITAGATLDVQAEDALGNPVFRIRNSTDSADIWQINGNGQIIKGATTVIVPSVQSTASTATLTPVSGNDLVAVTAQAEALTIANPTGTWTNGQSFLIRLRDNGTGRAITYGGLYRAIGVTLPIATNASKTVYLGVVFNQDENTFDVIGVSTQA